MRKLKLAMSLLAGMTALTTGSVAAEGLHVVPIKEYLAANVQPWLTDPAIVDAVKKQNEAYADLSQDEIGKLDQDWRAQATASERPFVDEVLGRDISKFLTEKKEMSEGMLTEVIVTDAKGLNVGQSDVSSDYWQGDEAKWNETFPNGAGAIFVDEIEQDESTQALQSQASIAIADPATGETIGVVTIGINLDNL